MSGFKGWSGFDPGISLAPGFETDFPSLGPGTPGASGQGFPGFGPAPPIFGPGSMGLPERPESSLPGIEPGRKRKLSTDMSISSGDEDSLCSDDIDMITGDDVRNEPKADPKPPKSRKMILDRLQRSSCDSTTNATGLSINIIEICTCKNQGKIRKVSTKLKQDQTKI